MGRHSAPRAASRPARRRIVDPATAAVAVLLTAGLVLLGLALRAGPLAADSVKQAASESTTPAPATVVPGVDFTTRIYTLPELKKRYAAKGLSYVSGNPRKATTFTASSFNILGSSHAKNGPGRAARAGALARAKGASVVGLQEFQSNQRSAFLSRAGMVSYPDTGSRLEGENSIAWDPDVWEFVEGQLQDIPYFFGKKRAMPIVLLRHVKTGRMIWWMNVHNPADVFGCKCAGWRAKAVSTEVAKINALHADGTPVFLTGDLNDRSEVVCKIAVGASMASADGSHARSGSCSSSGDLWIDWVWGSGDQVTFSDYSRDYQTRNAPRISDHPIITATARIEPAAGDDGCKSYRRHSQTYWFCPDPTIADAE